MRNCKIWDYGGPTGDLGFRTGKNLTCVKDVLQDFGRITSFTDNDNRTYECYEVKNVFRFFLIIEFYF